MPVIEQENAKQQIVESPSLSTRPPTILEYARFLSLDEDSKEWLLERGYLTEPERQLVQEALDDQRPDVPDSEIVRKLGI